MKPDLKAFIRLVLTTVSLAVAAPPAWSAAFYISEIGTPGSLGTAGVANATNNFGADSAFTNPAGGIKGVRVHFSVRDQINQGAERTVGQQSTLTPFFSRGRTPHSTGERNVNPNEEHSRRPKGNR